MEVSFKEHFIKKFKALLPKDGEVNILELGSGTSKAIANFLKENNRIKYLGIEPSHDAYEDAREEIGDLPNSKLENHLAYETIKDSFFDLSFSLSVLEHVKHLDKFIEASVRSVKLGGYIIHRYDLGHALHPSSLKERFQVFLGNKFPSVLPEHKFVRYLDPEEVKREMERAGAEVFDITYHQMPNHKAFLKHLRPENSEAEKLCTEIIDWEYEISPFLKDMNKSIREKLFPAICVWGKRIK